MDGHQKPVEWSLREQQPGGSEFFETGSAVVVVAGGCGGPPSTVDSLSIQNQYL